MKIPKAIFICGSSGSGKTYLSKIFDKYNFIKINLDDVYETLLKKSGLGTKINSFDSDELSQAAKMMIEARKVTDDLFERSYLNKNNLIIDTTGASSSKIINKKNILESLGYNTFMVMMYTFPITAVERNITRDRTLSADIILKTWRDVYTNIDRYKNEFYPNFLLINNELYPSKNPFDFNFIKKTYIDPYKIETKPKSLEDLQKSIMKKQQINVDIENILKQPKIFSSLEEFQEKLLNFINT